MFEAKIEKNIGRKLENNFREGKKLEETFKKEFPKSFQIEEREISRLKKHTSERRTNYPKELLEVYNLVNGLSMAGGFDQTLINPNTKAKVDIYIPFNSFVFPARYLETLSDLSSSASPSFPMEFATKGLKLIIEQQSQFKEKEAFKVVRKSFIKREELLNINEDSENKVNELYKIYTQEQSFLERNETSELLLKEKLENKEEEYYALKKKERETEEELIVLIYHVPSLVRSQFVGKIKNDKSRNLVEDIATVETLFDLLDAGIIEGLTIEEKKVDEYLKELYPDPTLDTPTRNNIIKKGNEIRKKLRDSY